MTQLVAAPVRDATFVSAAHGWALSSGALYETTDGGGHWHPEQLPAASVTHVRFVSATVGYAWPDGGRLWLTTDGARSWRRGGLDQVDSLEGNGSSVWAIAGPLPYGHVERSEPATTRWTIVGTTPNRGGALLPHGDVTYVLGEQGAGPVAPSFDVYVGDRRIGNRTLPCKRGQRVVPESPMAVSTDGSLFLVCDLQSADGVGLQLAYASSDRGRSWTALTPPPKTAGGVAAVRGARFAWDRDLWVYRDGRWRVSLRGRAVSSDADVAGFNLIGFQDDSHGLALANTGRLYLTSDAGRTWRVSALPSRVPALVCRADELRVRGGRQGGGFGTAHVDIEITNVGRRPCALPSPSGLQIDDSGGRRLAIEALALDAAAGAGAVALAPQSHASLALSWQNWCGRRVGALSIELTVVGGTVVGTFDGPPDYDYWPSCVAGGKQSMLQVLGAYTVA